MIYSPALAYRWLCRSGELLLLREDGIRWVVGFWVGLLPPHGYSGPPSLPGFPVSKYPYQHLP
nr:MAG TPA: hypothetical protein [Caudoviricetes sp.]